MRNLKNILIAHNLHVSHLNKYVKELVVHIEQEFSFSTLAAWISKPFSTLFFCSFKNVSKQFFKRFLAAVLSDMKCLPQHYKNFYFSGPIKAWHFLFLQWRVTGKCGQSKGCFFEPSSICKFIIFDTKNVPCLSTSRYYHLVSWGIPFVVACLPLINDHYGPAGAWW